MFIFVAGCEELKSRFCFYLIDYAFYGNRKVGHSEVFNQYLFYTLAKKYKLIIMVIRYNIIQYFSI